MKNKLKLFILLLIPVFLLKLPVLAFDVSELGDYNSRSMYFNSKKDTLTQEKIEILKSKKLSPTIQCLNKQIKKNNLENINLILETNIDINASYLGETPLYIAVKNNNPATIKLLIENNAKPDRGMYSELYEAIKNKNEQIAQLLLDNKSKVNYITMVTSETILYTALKNNMLNIASQLIKKGAYIDEKSAYLIKKKNIILN